MAFLGPDAVSAVTVCDQITCQLPAIFLFSLVLLILAGRRVWGGSRRIMQAWRLALMIQQHLQ
jgi:hypothetical protein